MLSLDFKMFFLPKSRIQPYFLAGFGYSWLSLKETSSIDVFATAAAVEKAKFSGLGLDAGFGLMLYFNPQVSINAGWIWREMYYGDVKNIDRFGNTTVTSEDQLKGSSRAFDVGLRVIF